MDKPTYRVITIVSRPKDNQNVTNFKPTSRAELVNVNQFKSKTDMIEFFVKKYTYLAKDGETFRIYESVNERNIEIVQKELMHALIDQRVDLTKITGKVASIAAKPESALTHHWLFDVDYGHAVVQNEFLPDLLTAGGFKKSDLTIFSTVNHYGVIVPHGFDTRELLKQYPSVELKRDDMRYLALFEKQNNAATSFMS